jgi:acyl-CoA thioester hydrolase
MKYSFCHETTLRVRYGETDQMGYCYYGCYAQYFEVGRVEAIRNLGMTYKELENIGIMLPVSEYNVKYLKPAFYDDELTIRTIISEINGARIHFDYLLFKADKTIVATASTTLVFVNRNTMRPISVPEVFASLISGYQND